MATSARYFDLVREMQAIAFTFDTGASGSFLSIRYYKEFRRQAQGWKKAENATAGGGGMVRRKVSTSVVLRNI